jgi:hypothetical protein
LFGPPPSTVAFICAVDIPHTFRQTDREMALGAKRHPLSGSAFAPTELNLMTNQYIFFKLFAEPLYLLLCLSVVRLLTFKLRLQAAYLNLKVRYLSFKIGKLVLRKRELLHEYSRRAMLVDELFNPVDQIHGSSLSANDGVQPEPGFPAIGCDAVFDSIIS